VFVLGLQGSPRKKGNTNHLLARFMAEVEATGALTQVIHVSEKNIIACKGCSYCEKNGYCITQNDDMESEIYPLLRRADLIVAATPMYFYNAPSQLKALIDRSQTMWARKYRFNLDDPNRKMRRGFLLSLGATKGKNLFEGIHLTARYFFDAVGAEYNGSLSYRRIENPGDMKKHPTVEKDVENAVQGLLPPFSSRKKILFACRENACRSQMAAAFAQYLAGDKIESSCAGSKPAKDVNPDMMEAMREKGIDMAFRKTRSLDEVISESKPDLIVTMGCEEECPLIPGVERQDWDLPDPAGKSFDVMQSVRDRIEERVEALIKNI